MVNACNWQDLAGNTYEYKIYEMSAPWSDVPGNYVFAELTADGWLAHYAGETSSFKNRLTSNHDGWICAARKGASAT